MRPGGFFQKALFLTIFSFFFCILKTNARICFFVKGERRSGIFSPQKIFMDKYALAFCSDIYSSLEDGFKMEGDDTGTSKTISGHINAGALGADLRIDILQSGDKRFNIKIKATQSYKYRVSEIDAAEWQSETNEKYSNNGYSVYFTSPTLTFVKFLPVGIDDAATAKSVITRAVAIIKKIIPDFEKRCVNFDMENEHKETEYDPTKVELKTVDDKFHATSASEEDAKAIEDEDSSYAKERFEDLAKKYKAEISENKKGLPSFKFKDGETDMMAVLHSDDADIELFAIVPANDEAGAMYVSHAHSSYDDLTARYDKNSKLFTLKADVFPYKYTPTDVEDAIASLTAAAASCKAEWSDTLDKKDSEKFAMEMQNIMSEQAKKLTERENSLSEKEKEIENLKKEMESSKAELKDREEKLREREEEFEREKENTEEKIKKIKEEAEERVKKYEEQNTKDIMNMQSLAKQISLLQDRLNAAPSSSDADAEDEIARLKAKTRQLTLQKASVEKEMKNVVSERDAKIKRLSDVITEREQDIAALKKEMNTKVSAKVEKETMKSQGYVSELESKLKNIGHIITPDEIFEYYKKNEDEDAGVEEKHAANATIISFKDGELDVAIRVGDMLCSVEVSKNTVVSDKVLRRLNTKFGDIKFFISPTQQQTTARAYFAPNASLDQIDSTLDRVLENFKK